jgi:hypothetical protein
MRRLGTSASAEGGTCGSGAAGERQASRTAAVAEREAVDGRCTATPPIRLDEWWGQPPQGPRSQTGTAGRQPPARARRRWFPQDRGLTNPCRRPNRRQLQQTPSLHAWSGSTQGRAGSRVRQSRDGVPLHGAPGWMVIMNPAHGMAGMVMNSGGPQYCVDADYSRSFADSSSSPTTRSWLRSSGASARCIRRTHSPGNCSWSCLRLPACVQI